MTTDATTTSDPAGQRPDTLPQKYLLTPDGALRCSDAERELTVAALAAGTGSGRLSVAEADERIERAYSARHRHELEALTADLPGPDRESPGWPAIARSAREQISADVARTFGRFGVTGARQVRVALVVIAGLLLTALLVLAFLHGVLDEGPEIHGVPD